MDGRGDASEGRGELGKETPSTLLGASRAGALRARARLDNETFNIGTAMPRRGGASSEKGTPTTLLGTSRVGAPKVRAGAMRTTMVMMMMMMVMRLMVLVGADRADAASGVPAAAPITSTWGT